MDKELLMDSLREEFSEEITEIIYRVQFYGKNYLDINGLNQELTSLRLVSFRDSLSEDDWFELLYEFAPEVYDQLSYGNLAA
ncbi:MAG: hypothetical protein CME62_07680 [Halobacteriovoraceae bacterium]|nr:hypothetical protein [Halobacteriovoraceae bacterium]|tara:strand:+ start:1213 stop:1458 length:246 start_codon:yes stop_codon:yes gene_type:complete